MRQHEDRAWHYIKPNESVRIPRRHIFIDTEARLNAGNQGYTHTFRLAVACMVSTKKGGRERESWLDCYSRESLWEAVSGFADSEGRTVVWTHNLGYDARIGDLFSHLSGLSWSLEAHNTSAHGAWLEWRKGKSTLVFADSTSIFPTTIAQIGKWFGIAKPDVEIDCDDDEEWLKRCRIDCLILRTAIGEYLKWIESDELGNWQITGNGQSWAAFRHRFLTHKMCVHNDSDALSAERRAMWTGRCEAYWLGELSSERLFEWDFEYAYPRIAAEYSVPIKLLGQLPEGYDWRALIDREKSCLLADVIVNTDVPVVPCKHEGRIVWPTGTFETTLWDVEIRAAIASGASVRILRGWAYRKAPALKAWGDWILSSLAMSDDDMPAWRKAVLKHWSRALIGRMAMTYADWEPFADLPLSDLRYGTFYDSDTGEEFATMQVGSKLWKYSGRVEWRNSMPMINGYIQSIARVQLWDVIRQLPERSAVYVDTDSVFVTGKYFAALAEIAGSIRAANLRLKRAWDGFAIYGPRQIVTGAQVRISGVPRRAIRLDKHLFSGEIWETLQGSMQRGRFDSVVTKERKWQVGGVDYRRTSIGFGWTKPKHIKTSQWDAI